MGTIFKTWKKATYLGGMFLLVENQNMAKPIQFPTVFVAYGRAIKKGNFKSLTSIVSPSYVIDHYFDTVGHSVHDAMYQMWVYCKQLNNITWEDVMCNKDSVLELINLANNELLKLETL
jgi:hypothetical protein